MKDIQILIVEDENIVAMEISDRLMEMGYQVCKTVSSGEAALKFANQLNPDLILMDIMIKGELDGIEAAAQIRRDLNIPVIYLTAFTDEATLQRAKTTEPFGYIIKPFVERELHTTIEMALHKHQMEQRLKESERFLATTLKSINEAVVTTNETGIIKFVNPIAEKMLGQTGTLMLGKPFNMVLHLFEERNRLPVSSPFEKLLKSNPLDELMDATVLVAADGRERIISSSCAPLLIEDGTVDGYVFVFRDITEKRKLESDLLRAQKLESIGILAGGIAHDFNNILTAIIGNISLAKSDISPGEELYVLLQEAEQASLKAKYLTQQLLTFSKGGTPLKRVVSLGELLKASTEFALRGSNVTCQFSLPENLQAVEIDVGQISQVVQNIVINAKQAMPDGGCVEIVAENVGVNPESNLPLKSGKFVKILVKDDGCGIPRELLPKIFDPYFTTKQKESGLGLAVSYSIVKKHGGHIRVDSKVNIGTTVEIYLPGTEKTIKLQTSPSIQIRRVNGRILLMDDEDFIQKIAVRMLNRFGLEVVVVSNGTEAIEQYQLAQHQGKRFDAVILDLTIRGGMGGKETMQHLKKIDPEVKAFVSSGYSNDPIISGYQQFGFWGAILKPYKLNELEKALYPLINQPPK